MYFAEKGVLPPTRAPAPPGGQMAIVVSLLYGGGGEVW